MKLQELLKNIEPIQIVGDADVEVSGVNIDSRKIKEGHLFVAIKGTQVDGHQFISRHWPWAQSRFCARICLRRKSKA